MAKTPVLVRYAEGWRRGELWGWARGDGRPGSATWVGTVRVRTGPPVWSSTFEFIPGEHLRDATACASCPAKGDWAAQLLAAPASPRQHLAAPAAR